MCAAVSWFDGPLSDAPVTLRSLTGQAVHGFAQPCPSMSTSPWGLSSLATLKLAGREPLFQPRFGFGYVTVRLPGEGLIPHILQAAFWFPHQCQFSPCNVSSLAHLLAPLLTFLLLDLTVPISKQLETSSLLLPVQVY